MAAALNQKLIASVILLTVLYSTLIFITYYDLMRAIGRSLMQLLPGIAMLAFGAITNAIFLNPSFVFENLLPIKSGFAKGIIGTTIFPYVGASLGVLTIISGFSLLIDKIWFYWHTLRIPFLIRMLSVAAMVIITVDVLFNFIYIDLKELPDQTSKLSAIGIAAGVFLSVLLLLIILGGLSHKPAHTNNDDQTLKPQS